MKKYSALFVVFVFLSLGFFASPACSTDSEMEGEAEYIGEPAEWDALEEMVLILEEDGA